MQVSVAEATQQNQLVELTSGVDALYLSGRADLSGALLERLGEGRRAAESSEAWVPFDLGGVAFALAAYGFGRYCYRLDHANGVVGITPSEHLPAIRIQPALSSSTASVRWRRFDGSPIYWNARSDRSCSR